MKFSNSKIDAKRNTLSIDYYSTGSVMTEYLVTTGVVIVALIVPIPGLGQSALDILIQALNEFQAHSTVLLSMP